MKNILKKLHEIMSEVDFIAKDKTNEFHKYNYASEQAIKEKMHQLLVSHKVLFMLSGNNIRHAGTLTDIDFTYRFYDIESGEFIEGTMPGTGEDKLDKGTYKAITGAIKYILTSTFLIPTGDDPENEEKKPKSKAKANYTGTQYQDRKTPTQTEKTGFEEGDKLLRGTSKGTGKTWYAIEKPDKTRVWLKQHQYEALLEGTAQGATFAQAQQVFSDGAPLPSEY